MRWEAANTSQADTEESDGGAAGKDSGHRRRQRQTETAEASLARLSRSYSTAMNCVGALHKAMAVLMAEKGSIDDQTSAQLRRVAKAARSSFENGVLLDPLIVELISTLYETMKVMSESCSCQNGERWRSLLDKPRAQPPSITSAAHGSSIRQLAYLSLTNYAELLLMSCGSSSKIHENYLPGASVALENSTSMWFWENEEEDETQRLALVAFCDASQLDGSDPTLWLRIANTARGLDEILNEGADSRNRSRRFERLERHALESGRIALPANVPPNRTIMQALERAQMHSHIKLYPERLSTIADAEVLYINLPRYSWSTLGRMLLKVCREGTSYHESWHRQDVKDRMKPKCVTAFGSPQVKLRVSPIIALPSYELGKICQYLNEDSIWNFEATCRALSASIISARASMEEKRSSHVDRQISADIDNVDDQNSAKCEAADDVNQTVDRRIERRSVAYRSSKRVRSQLITSGKKAERMSRRSSVEFCLLASTLSVTSDCKGYVDTLKLSVDWEHLLPMHDVDRIRSLSVSEAPTNDDRGKSQEGTNVHIGFDASLTSFINHISSRKFVPVGVLTTFLAHVARNVEEVFVDAGGIMVLASCVIDSVDFLGSTGGYRASISPSWFGSSISIAAISMDEFAVNLLNAELRLKRCERYSVGHDFDNDSNCVSAALPVLLAFCNKGRGDINNHKLLQKFVVRCHWLAATFFIWRSRVSQNASESRLAETIGLEHVEQAIGCLEKSLINVVLTPHLESPGRKERYWKGLSISVLSSFRDKVQASSIVSVAREQFLEIMTDVYNRTENSQEADFSSEDIAKLKALGEKLLKRYDTHYNRDAGHHEELVTDFCAVHCESLSELATDGTVTGSRFRNLWNFIPSGRPRPMQPVEIPNPSILTILATCLQARVDGSPDIIILLARLVIAVYDQIGLLQRPKGAQPRKRGRSISSNDSESDEDESFSDSESSYQGPARMRAEQSRHQALCLLVQLLVDKIIDMWPNVENEDKANCLVNDDFLSMIHFSLVFSADWYGQVCDTSGGSRASEAPCDRIMFESICLQIDRMLNDDIDDSVKSNLKTIAFIGIARVIVSQRQIFPSLLPSRGDNRTVRSTRQKLCTSRAEYIATVACKAASILSKNLSIIRDGQLVPSPLIRSLSDNKGLADPKQRCNGEALVVLLDATIWFWKYSQRVDYAGNGSTNTFDFPIVDILLSPIAALVISICGSASTSDFRRFNEWLSEGGESCRDLAEFFDSDASANELESDDEQNSSSGDSRKKMLLRVVCQAVHCVTITFESLQDTYISSHNSGHMLPQVVLRVLNHFSEVLLVEFHAAEDDKPRRHYKWDEEYPTGTQKAGTILDASLCRAYRFMHGFTLTSHGVSGAKDSSGVVGSRDGLEVQWCNPESEVAAAQLFRCILRTYSNSRKSPPKAALECVLSALPSCGEDARGKQIKSFLFAIDEGPLDCVSVGRILKNRDKMNDMMSSLPLCADVSEADAGSLQDNNELELDETSRVRRGVYRKLALGGALPQISHSIDFSSAKGDECRDAEQREIAAQHERQLSKRFHFILDFLCVCEPDNYEAWYQAGQCINMKAELVANRLGLMQRASDDLGLKNSDNEALEMQSLSDLRSRQKQAHDQKRQGWIPYLGTELSLFVRLPWAKFSSLQEISREIERRLSETAGDVEIANLGESKLVAHGWQEIARLHERGDYVAWQQAWGGMFVSALRKIGIRCLGVALCLADKRQRQSAVDETIVVSEVSEALGTAFYSHLMGSQEYGYPMYKMSQHRKRTLAEAALLCFGRAIDSLVNSESDEEDDGSRQTWDLQFMVGKCHEKIASTYDSEAFYPRAKSGDAARTHRQYEYHMEHAFSSYTTALAEAKLIEHDGGLPDVQAGGSEHGAVEIFFRIHASRLKCLLSAVRHRSTNVAEEEAIRLATKNWFGDPSEKESIPSMENARARIWAVLGDIVAALAQCRLDQPHFHRSVYRHAQALMWAAVFHDPKVDRGHAALESVPASRSYQIRGLNSATSCAQSAEVVMAALFEKKRPQLCAVWVTTPSGPTSPFTLLNTAFRKYDALRAKYLSAYIDCLRLCDRESRLETVLQWVQSAKRDLPSFFRASAVAKGGSPTGPHRRDNLIKKPGAPCGLIHYVKRQLNIAIAKLVSNDLSLLVSMDDKKSHSKILECFKTAYACYLRLNCTVRDIERTRSWKYGRSTIPEVEVLCQAFLATKDPTVVRTEQSNWSGGSQKLAVLNAAIEKSQELFPTLQSSIHSKAGKKKGRSSALSTKKRDRTEASKEEVSTTASSNADEPTYVVTVPEGLKEGDTFRTTMTHGEVTRQVQITVPKGNPRKIMFRSPAARKRPKITGDNGNDTENE